MATNFWNKQYLVAEKYLINFLKKENLCWKFLAIDIKLILFAYTQFNLISLQKELTMKRIHNNNLDKTFSS